MKQRHSPTTPLSMIYEPQQEKSRIKRRRIHLNVFLLKLRLKLYHFVSEPYQTVTFLFETNTIVFQLFITVLSLLVLVLFAFMIGLFRCKENKPHPYKLVFRLDSASSMDNCCMDDDSRPQLRSRMYWELSNRKYDYTRLENEEDNDLELIRPYPDLRECQPMYEWQVQSHPSCNIIHENEIITTYRHNASIKNSTSVDKLVGIGWWRYTFLSHGTADESIAFKALRLDRPLSSIYIINKHKIDAIISDRMIKSKNIINIHGYCSTSGMYEYANGGYNLEEYLFRTEEGRILNKMERLSLALNVVYALSDLHSIESINGYSPIVHCKFSYIFYIFGSFVHDENKSLFTLETFLQKIADIIVNQYVMTKSTLYDRNKKPEVIFKLNDFNRGHLMYWNTTSNTSTCPYQSYEANPGAQRSPEEILYTPQQTEKIDVWALGHILYMILTNEYPIYDLEMDEEASQMENIQQLVASGAKPIIPSNLIESENVVDQILIHVILDMCLVYDWKKRKSMIEIREYFENALRKLPFKAHDNTHNN